MKRFFYVFLWICWVPFSFSQPHSTKAEQTLHRTLMHQSVHALTETIVHDILSPPVASRVYAYTMTALYEGIHRQDPTYRSLYGQLGSFPEMPQPEPGKTYHWLLVGTQAFFETAGKFVFSTTMLAEKRQTAMSAFEKLNIPPEVAARSTQLGNAIAARVVAWSKTDQYAQTRSMRRYDVKKGEDKWQPTPPNYMAALEPNWSKIRPFVMDSSAQFRVEGPPKFDMTPGSKYHTELMRVYQTTKTLTAEQKWIADFWDDSPATTQYQGHLAITIKKISPPAHWIGITEMATNTKKSSPVQTAEAYCMVSLALADGFIAAWEQKYADEFVRPITVIRKYIDPEWRPMLETPPFPEHTSGHSVISMAAATVLAHFFGNKFRFTDRSEESYGIKPRTFRSFEEAATEAGMSRLYGGIHYLHALVLGKHQGALVGKNVYTRIQLRKSK
ncbi:MAG: vanadium-dependent haloperoxidase [Bacteroidetes Order II. Incertae sedis bacterium]|nr:vanadium-dependent haloperoxidase [Bacteroidetes Order II. bacterium]